MNKNIIGMGIGVALIGVGKVFDYYILDDIISYIGGFTVGYNAIKQIKNYLKGDDDGDIDKRFIL